MKRRLRCRPGAAVLLSLLAMAQPDPGWSAQDGYRQLRHRMIAGGYRPFRRSEPGRSDLSLNDAGTGTIRARFPELVSCSGIDLNDCWFLWQRAGRIEEIVTNGETPDDLHVEQVRRISAAAAAADYRQGCDLSDRPDFPCPF